jgi:uncharacterized protein (DUF305 family)
MKSNTSFMICALMALLILGGDGLGQDKTVKSVKETDIQFLDMMMEHHADGVEMARMGIEKAQNAEVKALADKMAAGQQKDIDEMRKMREAHFPQNPKAEMMTVKGRTMTSEMMEKMAQEDMRKLETASGAEFDRAFLDVFMKHHQMALDMSKEETSKGEQPEVKKKAREIIAVQSKEMAEMRRLKTRITTKSKNKTA